jgi:hypothetical protein
MMFRALLLTAAIATLSTHAKADHQSDRGRFRIHVLTMGQGEELFTRFGHIAIMVEDRVNRTKKVYNFGTFDFSDPDLRVRYVRGFLNYWLSVGTFSETVRRYEEYDRELTEHTLNLTADQAAEVAQRLEVNARPENRTYAYRHYLDNCCTRIRDLIDDVTDGALSKGRNRTPTGRTYRYWTRKALTGMPVMSALILFSLGTAVDRPITRWDEEFLPVVVAEDLAVAKFGPDNRPLVSKRRIVVTRKGGPCGVSVSSVDLAVSFAFFGILALGLALPIALGQRPASARFLGFGLVVWGLIAGLGGLALILYWTATTHFDTHCNENLLIMPVAHLWLLGPGFKLMLTARIKDRTSRFLWWYLVGALGLILIDLLLKIGPFIQSNYGFMAFAAACGILTLAALKRTGLSPGQVTG